MRQTYDLRILKDQLQLGRELSPLIEKFIDDGKGREIPAGRIWDALEDLRRHLEVTQMDQLGRAPTESSVLAKLVGRMSGAAEVKLNPSAEDVIFWKGQKEGMRQLLSAICDHVGAALSAAAEARLKASEQGEKRFQAHRPGQSPM